MYDIQLNTYAQIKIENNASFEGRFCHSSILYNDVVAIYGGMQNAEMTLDSLVLLSYENKNEVKGLPETTSDMNKNGNNNNNK